MTFKITAAAILLSLTWPAPAETLAEIKTSLVYEYYEVALDENDSLSKSVFSATPIFHNGGKFAGRTNCKTRYNYTFSRPSIGMCRVKTLTVTCDCTITLPRLTNGDAEARHNFKLYLLRLDEHERRHSDIAIDHANRIEASLGEVGQMKCEDLAGEMKARYDRIYEESRSAQARYDHQTRHGKYEGADITKYDVRQDQPPPSGSGAGDQRLTNPDNSGGSGIYQDADGVWRNY